MSFKYLFVLSLGLYFAIPNVDAQNYDDYTFTDEEEVDNFGNYSKFTYEEGDLDDLEEFGIESEDVTSYNPTRKIYANDFRYRWYIQAGGGVQMFFGPDDTKAKFRDRITMSPTLALGYRFNNVWGVRINFSGGSLHPFDDGTSGKYRYWKNKSDQFKLAFMDKHGIKDEYLHIIDRWDPSWTKRGWTLASGGIVPAQLNYLSGLPGQIAKTDPVEGFIWAGGTYGGLYMKHLKYIASDMSLTMNFTNLIYGSGDEKFFDASIYAGPTLFHVEPQSGVLRAYNGLAFHGGFQTQFHLNKNLAVFTDFKIQFMPEGFDGTIGGNMFELITQANLGLTYKFAIEEFTVLTKAPAPQIVKEYDDQLEKLRLSLLNELNEIENLQPEIDDIRAQLNALNTRPKEPEIELKSFFLPNAIYFQIGKTNLDATSMSVIQEVADYLNNNPGASVIVTGFADRGTGNATINQRLSQERAKGVADALQYRFHIDMNRIAINWEGDIIQPRTQNDLNRTVLFYIDYE